MNAINWDFSEALVKDYAPTQVKQTNYFSPDFEKILNIINSFLAPFGVPRLEYNSSTISESNFNSVEKNGSCLMWRVTSDKLPALKVLCESQTRLQLINQLQTVFPKYITNEVVKVNTFKFNTKASIVIMPCGLDDNTWTSDDLKNYYKDSRVKHKLDEIEQRMFRRSGDTRSTEERWKAFIDTDYYENKLPTITLTNISGLQATHSLSQYSLDTPDDPDFTGTISNTTVSIEAKSKKRGFEYQESDLGKYKFAEYWYSIKDTLGSLHNAKFILLIDKVDGKIVCLERMHPENNWLAGYIDFTNI